MDPGVAGGVCGVTDDVMAERAAPRGNELLTPAEDGWKS